MFTGRDLSLVSLATALKPAGSIVQEIKASSYCAELSMTYVSTVQSAGLKVLEI